MTRWLLAALLLALPAPISAAEPPDDWRPPRVDRLAAMDAAMASMLTAFQPSLDAVLADIGVLTATVLVASPDQMAAEMALRSEAAVTFRTDVRAFRDLAASALGTLREHPSEPCWGEYAAVQTTGWLLAGDGAQGLEAGDLSSGQQLAMAAYMLVGDWAGLVHGAAVAECAA